ncbi:hypothetical protein NDI99_19535 [Vibrio alginolyticus]|uniref:hypothetical protein n=2 Tax=Vibrio harveyi group TaxID=717610 RepID=UPI00215F31FB|nr:hypothetical protein [Vibrio alginolyticus]MCS0253593.1 hypothetical protein [Vibrio alginolyticus]
MENNMNLTELFNDSIMQSMLLSPLMGVVFAAIFSGLSSAPALGNATTVIITEERYRERIIDRRERANSHSSADDAKGVLFFAIFALCFSIWKYATIYDQVLTWLAIAIFTVFAFSFTTIAISVVKGQYTSNDWWFYTLAPLVYLSACLFLVDLAYDAFDPKVQKIALETNVIEFYVHKLTDFGRKFMMLQLLGLFSLVLTLVLSALIQVHYLSLLNIRGYGRADFFWQWLAKMTVAFSKKGWVIFATVLLLLAFITLEPSLGATWWAIDKG